MTIGQAIEIEIERRDISQRIAAAEIGVSQQVLSRWILGQAIPGKQYSAELAAFLRTSQTDVRTMIATDRRNRIQAKKATTARLADLEQAVIDLRGDMAELRQLLRERR